MKRYEQGSTDMRPDPEGLWCDYTEVQAEIERLRGLLQWWLDAGPDADWDEHERCVREALEKK